MFNFNRITQVFRSPDPDGGGGDPAPVADPASPAPTIMSDPAPAPSADPAPSDPFYKSIPETWRNELVDSLGLEGDDATKRLAQLGRVTDMQSFTKNYFEAQDKIREGVKPVGLGENPTDEQIAEYRETNGIPDSAEGYGDALEEGLVLGDTDSRIMDEVFKVAHDLNIPSDQMGQLTNAMLTARAAEEQQIVQQDGLDTQNTRTMLNEQWGADYQTNINMIQGLTQQLPESIRDDFMNARMADGRAMFNSPEVAQFFADVARKVNPAGTVVPNSANPTEAIDSEITKLEARMGTDEWHKDSKAQQRYLDLITAQDNMRQ
jgi:hypothetical protein